MLFNLASRRCFDECRRPGQADRCDGDQREDRRGGCIGRAFLRSHICAFGAHLAVGRYTNSIGTGPVSVALASVEIGQRLGFIGCARAVPCLVH